MSSGNKKQYVYLDFDGAETFYKGELLNIEQIFVASSGFSEEKIAQIVAALNEKYNGEVIFTAQKPVIEEYSTVFVGQTDAFAEYGDFAGIAETIDRGNQNKSDNAFVMVDAAAAVESVVDVISHEVGHIVYGTEHAEQTDTLADFAAAVLNQPVNITIGGIDAVTYAGYEKNFSNLPSGAKFQGITGSIGDDVITFSPNKGRSFTGPIDLGSGNDKLFFGASSSSEDAMTNIWNERGISLGSGNDTVEIQGGNELWGGFVINGGEGDDKILATSGIIDIKGIEMGNGSNTIEIKNAGNIYFGYLNFGSGNDSIVISGAGSEMSMTIGDTDYRNVGELSFGDGNDTLNIGAKSVFCTEGNIDFGSGSDKLILNGGINFDYRYAYGRENSVSISSLENISGSGWIGITDDDDADEFSLSESSLSRFKNAGIRVYNNFGFDGFMGSEEVKDNSRSSAATLVWGEDYNFWLCGKSKAQSTDYGLADTVDWVKFDKKGKTTISVEYDENSDDNTLTLKLYNESGTYLKTLNSGDEASNNLTSYANGIYYLELTVKDSGMACGELEIETEKVSKPFDLLVKNFTIGPSTIASNGSVTLTFDVMNEGSNTASASKVRIYDGTKVLKTLSVNSLGSQKSQHFTVTLKSSELAGLGKRTLYVEADAEKKITEYSESNNKVSGSVTVKKIADLVVKDFKVSASTIASNGSVNLTFKVANDGEYTAAASQLRIYDGSKVLKTLSVNSLGAKKSQSFTVSLKGSELGLGKSSLAVTADTAKQVTEYSESNNQATGTVTVKKIADLVVKDFKVSASTVASNGSVKLTFKVANDGEYTAGASKVRIYDGSKVIKTLSVNSLGAKKAQSFTVTLKSSELAGLGKRTLYVEADGERKVAEYSESNNKSYCTVDITGGTPDWLSAGFGDYGEADGFDDLLVSSKDLNLSADLGSDDEYISGLAAALGEDWTFAGVADWNGDGSLEVLFCGSEHSQLPGVDENNKLLITLA